jgi:hypothetical protein
MYSPNRLPTCCFCLSAARPLLHALLLQGVAHGYGVELDRVKVAKAEAFCRGVLEELSQRGAFACDDTAAAAGNGDVCSKEGSSKGADVSGAAADQQQQQQQTLGESVGSQPCGSEAAVGHADSLSIDASSSQASDAATAAASGTAAAAAASHSGAIAVAAGGSGSGKVSSCKGAKVKGLLQQPQSSPIITCASIEQVR